MLLNDQLYKWTHNNKDYHAKRSRKKEKSRNQNHTSQDQFITLVQDARLGWIDCLSDIAPNDFSDQFTNLSAEKHVTLTIDQLWIRRMAVQTIARNEEWRSCYKYYWTWPTPCSLEASLGDVAISRIKLTYQPSIQLLTIMNMTTDKIMNTPLKIMDVRYSLNNIPLYCTCALIYYW